MRVVRQTCILAEPSSVAGNSIISAFYVEFLRTSDGAVIAQLESFQLLLLSDLNFGLTFFSNLHTNYIALRDLDIIT